MIHADHMNIVPGGCLHPARRKPDPRQGRLELERILKQDAEKKAPLPPRQGSHSQRPMGASSGRWKWRP